MIEKKDDTFLARWLNDELTEEELKAFQEDPEYPKYQKIVRGTEAIQSASFDEGLLLQKIKEKQGERSSGETIVRSMWTYAAAAVIALLVGFYIVLNWETTQKAGYGTQLAFNLPDNSGVTLNSNSSINYKKRGWDENRKLYLEGEAFFNVSKGSTFTVETATGQVQVLGTQFNVRSNGDLFEVTCYEGKVEVTSPGQETTPLLPGNTYRSIGEEVSFFEESGEDGPGWMQGESTFKSMPVDYVLSALENQYNIDIRNKPTTNNLLFSGSFPHDDLEVALKIVLGSLQIEYTIKGDTVILESRS